MKCKKTISICIICLLVFLVGCSSKPLITSVNAVIFKDATEPQIIDCKVKEKYKNIKVDLGISCTEGVVKFQIKNSQNKVVWEGKVDKEKKFNKVKHFKAIEGTWKLYIISEKAKGSFNVKWIKDEKK